MKATTTTPPVSPALNVGHLTIPFSFIVLWSSGYIGGAVGLNYAEPFTMTFFRFGSAAVILLAVALLFRAPWPASWRQTGHIAVVGVLIQAMQFSGLYAGMNLGVPAANSALVVGTMPIFTALGAGVLLGERVGLRQWVGLACGLAGVALVLFDGLSFAGTDPRGYALVGLALFGITAGTLYQKRFCGAMDLRTGGSIQLGTAAVILLGLALTFETMEVDWSIGFLGSVGWLSIMNSIGAISLLYLMIRRGEASKVSSLFFLIPPVTAVMAAMVLGETLNNLELIGFGVSATGVYLATRN